NDLTIEHLNVPITPILLKDTNTMEVDPVKESLTNNLNKGKSLEIITSTSETTTLKLTMSIDKSFDASENILDTSTLSFEAFSTQIIKFF
ncbi:11988_t:CDS:1, partial [Funneliformis caledonium]